jgi:lipoate-protein ligase A
MMAEYRLLDTGLLTAAENMALNEILTKRAGAGKSLPTMRFLRFKPDAALLGYHQRAEQELHLEFCRENGIDVNRRLTGGGVTYFQTSSLGWELMAPLGMTPFDQGFTRSLERICTSAAKSLSKLGVNARFRPRNDIEVDGRKISGTGGFTLEKGMLFQGTVLIENEIEKFMRAMNVPLEKLSKHEIDSMKDRMAFLKDYLGDSFDMEKLKAFLVEGFAKDLGITFTPGGLTGAEKAELAERLPYFQSDEWIYAKRGLPKNPYWYHHVLNIESGSLSVNIWLDHCGRLVQKVLISGDFFCSPYRLVYDLEGELMGKKARPEVLNQAVLDYFERTQGEVMGFTPQQVAQTVADTLEKPVQKKD